MMTYEEQEKIERLVAKDENAQKLFRSRFATITTWLCRRSLMRSAIR